MENKHQSQIDNFQRRHYGCRNIEEVCILSRDYPAMNIYDLLGYVKTLGSDWYDKYLNGKGRR